MMERYRILWLVFLFFFGSAIAAVQASDGKNTATIKGKLLYKSTNKPASGVGMMLLRYKGKDSKGKANIEMFILDGKFPSLESDSEGRFMFKNIPPGKYVIKYGPDLNNITGGYLRIGSPGAESVGVLNLKPGDNMDLGNIIIKKE
ncbi:MAG: hypothetical protein WBB64_04475 [Anaerolineales bacterium]